MTKQIDFEKNEYWTINEEDVLKTFDTSIMGLSQTDAKDRLRKYGLNEVTKKKKRALIIDFILRFKSPLILILLVAGLISGFFRETLNAVIIFIMIMISVTMDFYQEKKAEHSAQLLKEKITVYSTVIRSGIKQKVKITEIVPGDIVLLSAGDIVPGDLRILKSKDLFINQSTLTGESFPVKKSSKNNKNKEVITDWENYLFQGTSVVSGNATGIVIKTGCNTEFGKIAKVLLINPPKTEFEKGIEDFGYLILKLTFILVACVFIINAYSGEDILDSLLFAVALAVGLTPELLPMVISINLTKGANDMNKKGVIVKKLSSIENFGSMDVLCTDKTGTLTENKIKLVRHIDINNKDDEKVLLYSYLNSYYETGIKSPLDEAVLEFKHLAVYKYSKVDEIPFDFTRKRLTVIVKRENKNILITKGAPEEVLKICTNFEEHKEVKKLTSSDLKKINALYEKLSLDGLRVLCVSEKEVQNRKSYSHKDETEMTFIGFIAFLDPPKETVKHSLKQLRDAGIELKILTGDNLLVTKHVCREINFKIKNIVSGPELSRLTDVELKEVVEQTNVFVRVNPEQKNKILNAIKSNKHVVGFLGDGINDSPSIKTADVGISVNNATDIAKDAADIILSKKSLNVLHEGVIDGRKTFGNTMKYIMMGTSSNFGNMASVAVASLFLPFLPMLPIQILLNNMLYDFSELTIPTDSVDSEYLKKPKKWDINFIKKFMLYLGPVSSMFDLLTFSIMLWIFHASASLFQTAWFIESLFTQILVIFVIRTRITPFYKSKPSKALIISSVVILLTALIIPYTGLKDVFKFTVLPMKFYVILVFLIIAYLILSEFVKRKFYERISGEKKC